jgi:hypothetical protein
MLDPLKPVPGRPVGPEIDTTVFWPLSTTWMPSHRVEIRRGTSQFYPVE